MFGFIIFMYCVIVTLTGVLALPSLLYLDKIKISWRFFAIFVLPAIVTAILIKAPWFAVDTTWRWIRLILLFSWVPAILELEHRGHVIYTSPTRKWFSRWILYSLLSVFTIWALNKTEGWGLVQAAENGKSWCWLAENNNGDDGYIFTRIYNRPLESQKVLDSVGSVYTYSIRWVENKIELSSPEDSLIRVYDPITRNVDHKK